MSAMEIPDDVAESAVAHGKKGIRGVYDQFGFLAQHRKALSLLGGDLGDVISGSRANFYENETHAGGEWERFYPREDGNDDDTVVRATFARPL